MKKVLVFLLAIVMLFGVVGCGSASTSGGKVAPEKIKTLGDAFKYTDEAYYGFGYDYYEPNTKGTKTLSLEEVLELKKKILLSFYVRPQYICRKMVHAITQPKVMLNYCRYGLKLLKNNLLK